MLHKYAIAFLYMAHPKVSSITLSCPRKQRNYRAQGSHHKQSDFMTPKQNKRRLFTICLRILHCAAIQNLHQKKTLHTSSLQPSFVRHISVSPVLRLGLYTTTKKASSSYIFSTLKHITSFSNHQNPSHPLTPKSAGSSRTLHSCNITTAVVILSPLGPSPA